MAPTYGETNTKDKRHFHVPSNGSAGHKDRSEEQRIIDGTSVPTTRIAIPVTVDVI